MVCGAAGPGLGLGPSVRAGGLISGEVNWEGARFWFYGLVPGRAAAGSLLAAGFSFLW